MNPLFTRTSLEVHQGGRGREQALRRANTAMEPERGPWSPWWLVPPSVWVPVVALASFVAGACAAWLVLS